MEPESAVTMRAAPCQTPLASTVSYLVGQHNDIRKWRKIGLQSYLSRGPTINYFTSVSETVRFIHYNRDEPGDEGPYEQSAASATSPPPTCVSTDWMLWSIVGVYGSLVAYTCNLLVGGLEAQERRVGGPDGSHQ